MRNRYFVEVMHRQIMNGKKLAAVVVGVHEYVDPHTANMLKTSFNARVVRSERKDYMRLRGIELHTVYVDEASTLDPETMEFLVNRVRYKTDAPDITMISSDENRYLKKNL